MLYHARILILATLALGASCSTTTPPYSIGAQDSVTLALAESEASTDNLLDIDVRLLWPLRQTNFKLLDTTNQSEAPDAITLRALRRAESDYLSRTLADRLQHSGHWGRVRLNPHGISSADLEVSGRIIQSDGQILRIQVDARDSRGTVWLTKQYLQTLPRLAGSGSAPPPFPFIDLFNAIANDLAAARTTATNGDAAMLRNASSMKFAAALAGSAQAAPPDRVEDLRTRHDAFLDAVQLSYGVYIDQAAPNYLRFLARTRDMTDFTNDRFQVDSPTVADINTGPLSGAESLVMEAMPRPAEGNLAPLTLEFSDRTVTLSGSLEEQFEQWEQALRAMATRP